jgi:hypothetical protein
VHNVVEVQQPVKPHIKPKSGTHHPVTVKVGSALHSAQKQRKNREAFWHTFMVGAAVGVYADEVLCALDAEWTKAEYAYHDTTIWCTFR